jgi:chemotaxis protein methyltransferase CheR
MNPEDEIALRSVLDLVESRFGLSSQNSQLETLAIKLRRALPALGVESFVEAYSAMQKNPEKHFQQVIRTLITGETYFFRNKVQFDALRFRVVPEIASQLGDDRPLIIWSAGCATGEEPYSLAMWLRQWFPELWPERLRIIATDINREFLDKAQAGLYGQGSLRQTEAFWREKCFTRNGSRLEIDQTLRRVISFQMHNLVSGLLPEDLVAGQVTLIFCRNVLLYFGRQAAANTLGLFQRVLTPKGFLMLGHTDLIAELRRWRTEYYPGTFYYRPPAEGEPDENQKTSTDSTAPHPGRTDRSSPLKILGTQVSSLPEGDRVPDQPRSSSVDSLAAARQAANYGDLLLADRVIGEFLASNKTSLEGHLLAALVHEELGDWSSARSSLRKAIFLDKNLVIAHYLLAVLEEKIEDWMRALKRYRTVHRLLANLDEENEIPFSDGLTVRRLRELAEARITEIQVS